MSNRRDPFNLTRQDLAVGRWVQVTCPQCSGVGWEEDTTADGRKVRCLCETCGGTGSTARREVYNVLSVEVSDR